jgi:hypothetical protein
MISTMPAKCFVSRRGSSLEDKSARSQGLSPANHQDAFLSGHGFIRAEKGPRNPGSFSPRE